MCTPHQHQHSGLKKKKKTNTLAIIPIYDRVLNAIEKALQELMKEYQGVRKSLQDLIEDQERNMVQLGRIGVMIEWR